MNKRAIVSVATGQFYMKMQDRLIETFSKCVDNITLIYNDRTAEWDTGKTLGIDLICWRDILPPGSRSHKESPYGFKVHAMKYAYEKGYTSVLWLDSPAYSIKEDVSPIFTKMEENGYYVMSHVDPLEYSVGEKCLSHFGASRDNLKGFNLPSGSCYGFSNKFLFDSLFEFEILGLFTNEQFCIDDIWRHHRHDEAVIALILMFIGVPVFLDDPLFQSDSPACCIKSGE